MTIGAFQQQQILMQNSRNIFAPSQSHHLTDTKGLLNGPGQNNCFLNCAVQVSLLSLKCSARILMEKLQKDFRMSEKFSHADELKI